MNPSEKYNRPVIGRVRTGDTVLKATEGDDICVPGGWFDIIGYQIESNRATYFANIWYKEGVCQLIPSLFVEEVWINPLKFDYPINFQNDVFLCCGSCSESHPLGSIVCAGVSNAEEERLQICPFFKDDENTLDTKSVRCAYFKEGPYGNCCALHLTRAPWTKNPVRPLNIAV